MELVIGIEPTKPLPYHGNALPTELHQHYPTIKELFADFFRIFLCSFKKCEQQRPFIIASSLHFLQRCSFLILA